MKRRLAVMVAALAVGAAGCELIGNSTTSNDETYTAGPDGTVMIQTTGGGSATGTVTPNPESTNSAPADAHAQE